MIEEKYLFCCKARDGKKYFACYISPIVVYSLPNINREAKILADLTGGNVDSVEFDGKIYKSDWCRNYALFTIGQFDTKPEGFRYVSSFEQYIQSMYR